MDIRLGLQERKPGKYSVETSMNRSGSHLSHENQQIIILTVEIRRGGAPPGAAAFIIFGGMGSQPPSVIP